MYGTSTVVLVKNDEGEDQSRLTILNMRSEENTDNFISKLSMNSESNLRHFSRACHPAFGNKVVDNFLINMNSGETNIFNEMNRLGAKINGKFLVVNPDIPIIRFFNENGEMYGLVSY